MNVVVTGSLGFDYIMDFSGRFADRIMPDKIHKISLSFLVDRLNKQFGGTAGNIAYTLKLLGIEPLIQSCSGNDFASYRQFLNSHKIKTDYIRMLKQTGSGTYFVVTDKDDNQIGAYFKGALNFNHLLSVKEIKEEIDFAIIAPNEIKAMQQYVRDCQKRKIKYLFDPAFQINDFSPSDLRKGIQGAEILIGNDYEIDLIIDKLEISHDELRVLGPKIIITTLGPKGSVLETHRESIHVKPAKPKNISDPTGAGDAYRAGFLAGYLRGYALDVCGQVGSVAAVYTVEKYGTVTHHFTKTEFIKRYKENFGTNLAL